jgi:hypothetical protein
MPILTRLNEKLQTATFSPFYTHVSLMSGGSSYYIQGHLGFPVEFCAYSPESDAWYETDFSSSEDEFDLYFRIDSNGCLWFHYYSDDPVHLIAKVHSAKELLELAQWLPALNEEAAQRPVEWTEVRCSELFEIEFCIQVENGKYVYLSAEKLRGLVGDEIFGEIYGAVTGLNEDGHPGIDWLEIHELLLQQTELTVEDQPRADFYANFGELTSDDRMHFLLTSGSLALTVKAPFSVAYLGDLIWYSEDRGTIKQYLDTVFGPAEDIQDGTVRIPGSRIVQLRESIRFRLWQEELLGELKALVHAQTGWPDELVAAYRAAQAKAGLLFGQ